LGAALVPDKPEYWEDCEAVPDAESPRDVSTLKKRQRVADEAEFKATTAEDLARDAKVVADTHRTVDAGLRYESLRYEAARLRREADDSKWRAEHPQFDSIYVAHPDGQAEEVLQVRLDQQDEHDE
jgi:hypothetical protein